MDVGSIFSIIYGLMALIWGYLAVRAFGEKDKISCALSTTVSILLMYLSVFSFLN